ncbi:uncharacterized protein LOC131000006 isoform X2 [Salvia miltiorrhiza]|uniref:uncharacterized protein LOC131000006 isoform X2 n=1 Tax=Salvia miltiorrhiza TaxID=226208 RepID=UPI0025AD8F6F|nr:uncharacterized protein LOC131000006 isoform X2 [Salvia miltiorrhiza]
MRVTPRASPFRFPPAFILKISSQSSESAPGSENRPLLLHLQFRNFNLTFYESSLNLSVSLRRRAAGSGGEMRSDSRKRITVSSAPRAPSADALEKAPDLASPCCASKEKSCFKENININKSGASGLCLEPQQMKKRKKGGKYNLRKSLAWDRAFSTEEGVLDPLELSAISGVSCRGGLPFIIEDTPVSSGQDEDFRKYKENNQSSPMLDFSSSKHMTSTSLALQKVPTSAGSKLGSKCYDYPRPLPSPSLKRRANVNVGKTTSKELKLPKAPGLRPNLSPNCSTIRSTIPRGSHVKHNRITQPDFSIQRDVEPKSSSKICNNTQNASRANTPQSARHSDGHLGCSSFNRHLSINTSPMTVDKAYTSGPKTTPVNVTQIRPENSRESQQYDSATLSQNAHTNGKILHPSQNQTMRPSGLRMPSPSLSFFSQPKPSIFRNLPLRDTDSYFNGSRNPGSLRLQDSLSRTTKSYDKIPDSIISNSKAICSRSESTAASHIQGPHKKKMTVRVPHEDAELQKIGIEVPSQNRSCEQAMDNFLKNAIGDCPVKSETCGSECRNAELGSKQNCAILESQTSSAIDEQYGTKNKCNLLVLDHDSTQCTDGFDDRVQNIPAMHSDWRNSSKQDCHEAHLEKTDPLKYSLGENERTGKNISNEKERVSEQMDVSQQGIYCSESMIPLEQGETIAESPYFVSKPLNAIKVLPDNLPAAEPHMQNSVLVLSLLTVEGCKNDTNLMSEIGNDFSQPNESSEVQDFHQTETESKQIGKLNIRDRLLTERQLSLQNSKQEENVDELLPVVSDRKDGTEILLSLSLDNRQKSNLGEETAIAQPLRMVECDYFDISFSSESCKSPISLHQDTPNKGSHDSPLPRSTTHQLSPEDTDKKTEEVPCLQVSYANNELTTTMSLTSSESEIDSHSGTKDTWALLRQSSESNMLDNRCFQQSECLALAVDEFVAGNLVHTDDCSAVNAVGGVKDSITSQNEILKSISRSSTPAKESPLKLETCNDEYETGGGSTADATTDPSEVEPFSDTIKVEVSEDTSNSLGSLHPKLNHDKVETTLLPNNKHEDGLEEKKSLLLVIPPNAIPFSDEWLAAMEAAGEDILTMKSGAVQNSPPDKSLPEPSPWSPVKKKNNQIGPFDCTKKFTAASDLTK